MQDKNRYKKADTMSRVTDRALPPLRCRNCGETLSQDFLWWLGSRICPECFYDRAAGVINFRVSCKEKEVNCCECGKTFVRKYTPGDVSEDTALCTCCFTSRYYFSDVTKDPDDDLPGEYYESLDRCADCMLSCSKQSPVAEPPCSMQGGSEKCPLLNRR